MGKPHRGQIDSAITKADAKRYSAERAVEENEFHRAPPGRR
jgi:hypothetical protein